MDPTKPDVKALYASLRAGGLSDEQARAQLAAYNVPLPADLAASAPAESSSPSPGAPASTPEPASPAPAATPESYGVARLDARVTAVATLLGPRFAQWAKAPPDEVASAVATVLSIERALLDAASPRTAITLAPPAKAAAPVVRPHPLSLSLQPPAPPSFNQPHDPYPHVAATDASATQHPNLTPVALPASVNVTPAIGANPSMARHGA